MRDDAGRGADPAFAAAAAGAAVLLLALLFRLWAIEGKFLWFDEFLSANLARHSWGTLLAAVHREAHPPLYFVLLKGWSLAFGDGRVAMKMFSLLAGMLALVFLADAARVAWGRGAALFAAVLFALSTVQIDQATDAKPYALLTMFLAALLACAVRLARPEPRAGWTIGACAAAAACASTHFYGGLAAIGVGLCALLAYREKRARRQAAAVLAVSAATFAFWLPPALRLPRGAADYIREIWGKVPNWAPLAVSARISLPGWRKPYPPMSGVVLPELSWREGAGLLAVLAVFFAAILWPRRGEAADGGTRRFLLLAGLALFFGFLAAETVLLSADRPVGLPGRFEVVTQMGLTLLASAAFARARRGHFVLTAAVALVGAATVLPQWRPRARPLPLRREEWIVRAVAGRAAAGRSSEIVTLGLARPPLEYYAAGFPQIRLISFPASQDEHPGWRTEGEAVARRAELEREAETLVSRLDRDLENGIEIYVAAREDPRNDYLLSRLRKDHDLVATPFADWFFRLKKAPVSVAGASELSGRAASAESASSPGELLAFAGRGTGGRRSERGGRGRGEKDAVRALPREERRGGEAESLAAGSP